MIGIVIRRGKELNATVSSLRFDRLGSMRDLDLIYCDTWLEGFQTARARGYESALFIDSGTVFSDWETWYSRLQQYPHRGLIGHIVWHSGHDPHLHDQCWYAVIDQFTDDAFTGSKHIMSEPVRSEKDIHHDYTPLYLRPGTGAEQTFPNHNFGLGLIAQQLNQGRPVVNWNQTMREHKHYLYANTETVEMWKQRQDEYRVLAESQLWILNNEPIKVLEGDHLLMPAAGLYWIINCLHADIDLVDISGPQLELVDRLNRSWDGHDYGKFVAEFVREKKIKHFQIDDPTPDPMKALKLRNPRYLAEYLNTIFERELSRVGISNFPQRWQQRHTVRLHLSNIVDYVLDNDVADIDSIWLSNILDYKWTLISTQADRMREFLDKLNSNNIKIEHSSQYIG